MVAGRDEIISLGSNILSVLTCHYTRHLSSQSIPMVLSLTSDLSPGISVKTVIITKC